MPRLFVLSFTLLCLVGCSAVTVGKCGPLTVDFLSREEHRAMVIHSKGCYGSWAQTPSGYEAERRALLLCSEAHPDTDTQCRVVATDRALCPITLPNWIKERDVDTSLNERKCELATPFVVNSAAGTEPPAVDDKTSTAITHALEAFGLEDYDPASGHIIVFGHAPESSSNWIVTEALHFVPRKDGVKTCVFRLSSGWDPKFKYFETEFKVQPFGCFENNESG